MQKEIFNKRIFSIGISTLQLNGLDNDQLCEQIKLCHNGSDDLKRDLGLTNPHLNNLNDIVLEQCQKILDGITENLKVKLKRVWGNHNLNSDICIPHTHRDSFLSAVYYPKSTDGKIHFYSPWTDAILSHVPINKTKEFNEYNSSYYELPVKTGYLVIFPAHLSHFVPISESERYSIAYDVAVG